MIDSGGLVLDCLNKIVTQDGVPALWSGTVASLMLTSNPAVHFMVYDALKRYLQKRLGGKVHVHTDIHFSLTCSIQEVCAS